MLGSGANQEGKYHVYLGIDGCSDGVEATATSDAMRFLTRASVKLGQNRGLSRIDCQPAACHLLAPQT